MRWTVTTTDGELIVTGEDPVSAAPYADTLVLKLDLGREIPSKREALVWLELYVDDDVVSDNLVLFARPKHLALREPNIHAALSDLPDGNVLVELSAEHPALWVWLSTPEGDLKYSDNFVHLAPGASKTVTVSGASSANDLLGRLVVQSLLDTYEQPEAVKG